MDLIALERTLLSQAWTSLTLGESLTYLCDECHGRFAGSDDECRAGDFLLRRFGDLGLENVHAEPFEMRGWERGEAKLTLSMQDGQVHRELPCMALAGSPSGQIKAEVVDVGAGTPADFARLGDAVRGRIVLAGAEGPHRLEKYALACQAGAAGFLFAGSAPGQLIPAGSLNLGGDTALIPGAGLAAETAAYLRRQMKQQQISVRLSVEGQIKTVTARNIVAELPGSDPSAGWIVVGGHYDGHDIAQGAQDNATGAVLVLETACALAAVRPHLKAGLRFVLFSGEEIGMFGSESYAVTHADELDHIRAVFNADIVGLAAPLVLMVQNSPELSAWLCQLPLADLDAQVVDNRLVAYSDHFAFTLTGVASLMAVTSPPGQGRGWAHTTADTLDKLELRPLREATATAVRILLRMAVKPEGLPAGRQPSEQIRQALIAAGQEQPLRLQGRWPF